MKKQNYALIVFFIFSLFKTYAQGDDCSTALTLTNTSNFCSTGNGFTNSGSTASIYANPSCWTVSTATCDVWFSFVASATAVSFTADGSTGGITKPSVAIYTGICPTTTSGTLSALNCSNGTTDVTNVYQGSLIIGSTYFVRVSSRLVNTGSFNICINNYNPTLNPGADCSGAGYLCNKNPVLVPVFSGAGSLTSEGAEPGSCFDHAGIESNGGWYFWECETAGTLTFDILPIDPTDDIDWFLVSINSGTNVCGARSIIRCNSTCFKTPGTGATGLNMTDTDVSEDVGGCTVSDPAAGRNAYCKYIDMVVGKTYAIYVNNDGGTNGLTINFGGTGTFKGPKPIITASSNTICAGQTVLYSASSSTNCSTYNWSFGAVNTPSTSTGVGSHTITYPSLGSYTTSVIGTDSHGCVNTQSTVVTVVNPSTAPTTTNVTYCQNVIAPALTAGGTNLLWYNTLTGGTGSVTNPTPNTSSVGTTTVYVSQTQSGKCESARSPLIITIAPTPTIVSTNTTICSGGSASLSAVGATTYTWSPSLTLSSPNGSVVTASPSTNTTYTILGSTGTCTNLSTVTVTVSPSLSLSVTPNNANICVGSSATLTATGATNYTWSPALNLSSANGTSVVANPSITANYTILGSTGTCTGVTTATVNVSGNLSINLTPLSPTICPTFSTTLTASGATNYTWSPSATLSSANGTTVNANPSSTTIYTVIGKDASGCQGTNTVTVNVANSVTVTTSPNVTICPGSSTTLNATGASSYTWNANPTLNTTNSGTVIASPTTNTTYSVSGKNSNGCIGTASVLVNIGANITITLSPTSPSICPGASTSLTASGATNYTWSPNSNLNTNTGSAVSANPNSTITYSVFGTDANGCSGTNTIVVSLLSNPSISVSPNATICPSGSATLSANGATNYTWSPVATLNTNLGSNVTASPLSTAIYTVTGDNGSTCLGTNTVQITLTNNPTILVSPNVTICPLASTTVTASGANSYTWTPNIFLNTNTLSNIICTPSVTTTYTVDGLIGACTGSNIVTVVVSNTLIVNAIATTPTICPLRNTSLVASGATSYTWTPSLTLSSANGSVVTASPTTSETYTVIGSSSTCTNSTQIVVTVTANPVISVVSNPSIICSGSSSILTASGANSYTWSPSLTLSSANGSAVNANPNSTTIYTITGLSSLGCLGSSTTTLTVIPSPNITTSANPLTICAGKTSTLSAFGASTYTWLPNSSVSNVNGSSTVASPIQTTTYTVTGSNGITPNICSSSNTIQIVVSPNTTVVPSPNMIICEGQSTTIYATGGTNYNWSPSGGLSNPSGSSTNIHPLNSGVFIYTVTATNSNICPGTATVQVTVNPLPNVYAGSDTTINMDDIVTLFGTGDVEVGFINPSDGSFLSCNYCSSITVNPKENTCYTLEGINLFGCRNTDVVCVNVTKDWNVYIPNAFTPNGDNYNELFVPVGYAISEIKLAIFDRWGHQIFESNDETIGWNGKNKGQLCEQGVYIYQAEITALSGATVKKTGHVTLLPKFK